MDRCAIFVDAGYVLAEAGRLCLGTRRRAEIRCDYAGLLSELKTQAGLHCGLQVLRTYWYDAAPNALPTAEQAQVAGLRHVKLRLGRLSGMHQKGVDALIYRDLMTLARERAMVVAFLVSGDEDLREGVVAAQDMGVQVVLVGVPSKDGSNQAQTLVHEADEHEVWAEGFWARYFRRPEPLEPSSVEQTTGAPDMALSTRVGAAFARSWASRTSAADLAEILQMYPRIPAKLDVQLLLAAEAELGPLRLRDAVKRGVREGFWAELRALRSDVRRDAQH
jgi:uncharacterized LabA/DUF88 family protein